MSGCRGESLKRSPFFDNLSLHGHTYSMSKRVHKLSVKDDQLCNFFLVGDLHSFDCCYDTVNIMLEHADMYGGNAELIILGDFLDCYCLMSKNPRYKEALRRGGHGVEDYILPEYLKEIAWGERMLDRLAAHFQRIIFMSGNHTSARIFEMKKDIPLAYRDKFDLEKDLNLKKRGIPYIDYGSYLDINDVSLSHGQAAGRWAIKSNKEACGKSAIQAHVHRQETISFQSRGLPVQSHSIPCCCKMPSDEHMTYLRIPPHMWCTGYAELAAYGGTHYYTPHVIKNGVLPINGKILTGKNIT